jgi:hypothetical protein
MQPVTAENESIYMKFIILFSIVVSASVTARAEERGLLASILNENCEDYIKADKNKTYEYETFCSGYFESLIEQRQFNEKKDIFDCFPTYGDYDPFKRAVIRNFMVSFDAEHSNGNEFVRAFNLASEAVDKEFDLRCSQK